MTFPTTTDDQDSDLKHSSTLPPTQTQAPNPTHTPSPSPSPVLLAVPERWMSTAAQAIEQLESQGTRWQWQLDTGGDAAKKVSQGFADLALVPSAEGIHAGTRRFALGVPFTSDWETITTAQAQEILTQGSPFVAVMDWAELPANLKALRVDGRHPSESEYPLLQTWSLVAAPGYEAAAVELSPIMSDALSADPVVHVAAVGDIMLDRALGDAIQAGDLDYPFAEVVDLLSPADLAIGNLETAIGDQGSPVDKGFTFRAPTGAAQTLSLAGFDLLSLANNHAMDFGPTALLNGMTLLHAQGIDTIGAGEYEGVARAPAIRNLNGITLAFLAYVDVPVEYRGFDTRSWAATPTRPGVAWADPAQIEADVASARSQADVVIVLIHSGFEYDPNPSPPQVSAARTAIDAGADLVLGHHAHVLQGIEFYSDGVIVYGLGNFAFDDGGESQSALLNVWLDQDGVRTLELVPVMLDRDGRPNPATEAQARVIRAQVYSLTTEEDRP